MRRLAVVALLTLMLIAPCSGAVVHGVVYSWENLKPLPKAIVVVNTTPEQRIVTTNGSYSFNLPPGHYVIRAYYYSNGRLVLYTEENITIKNNGSYILDLILFPPLNFNLTQPEVEFPMPSQQSQESSYSLLPVLAIICAGAGVFYWRKHWRKRKTVESIEDRLEHDLEALPDDLREVLEEIVRAGGRITQKELRQRMKCSEAKISLILTDLERRGYIEKVKKGRGNVIFLKDEKI